MIATIWTVSADSQHCRLSSTIIRDPYWAVQPECDLGFTTQINIKMPSSIFPGCIEWIPKSVQDIYIHYIYVPGDNYRP